MYDEDTIAAATSGDQNAIKRILYAHDEQLETYIARRLPRRLRGRFGVDDVLQEVRTKVWRTIASFEGTTKSSLAAWLCRMANNQLVSMVRAHRAQRRGGQIHHQHAPQDDSTGQPVDRVTEESHESPSRTARRREKNIALHDYLNKLPSDQKIAIKLRHLEDAPIEQIATQMNCSEGAVRGYLHRAKKQLRVWMGRSSKWLSSR